MTGRLPANGTRGSTCGFGKHIFRVSYTGFNKSDSAGLQPMRTGESCLRHLVRTMNGGYGHIATATPRQSEHHAQPARERPTSTQHRPSSSWPTPNAGTSAIAGVTHGRIQIRSRSHPSGRNPNDLSWNRLSDLPAAQLKEAISQVKPGGDCPRLSTPIDTPAAPHATRGEDMPRKGRQRGGRPRSR